MRIRRVGACLLLAAGALPGTAGVAGAQGSVDAVGNVGILSADIPAADLQQLESGLDRAVVVNASAARGRTATLSALAADPEISARRAEARRSADAGANAMRSLELDRAQAEFDKAATLFAAAHGDRLDTGDLSRLHTTRAKVALIRNDKARMREEFVRAMPLHPTKTLDSNAFPPDSVALFADVLATASRTPPSPPSSAALSDIARRSGLRWVVAGDARRGATPGSFVVAITLSDATGAAKATTVEIPPDGAFAALDAALRTLFAAAGVPASSSASNLARLDDPLAAPTATPAAAATASQFELPAPPTPAPTSAPVTVAGNAATRPVPAHALPPKTTPPKTKRAPAAGNRNTLYLVGAGVLLVGAGVAVAATSGGGGGGGGGEQGSGITLVIDRP